MDMTRFGVIFMLLIILSSQGMVIETEGVLGRNRCDPVLSSRFKGKCFSDHNCNSVCQLEGYTDGNCHGLRQRCFCNRKC
ncbi:hypothetical protein Lal_00050008 [Lupinus albus]|nr:hypothetical protein Lal_00050008 [Lupinus albus]